MLDQNDVKKIKETTEEFFQKMTIEPSAVEVFLSSEPINSGQISEVINLNIKIDEPQILIGEKGQTLFEIQRLLWAILTKKIFRLHSDRGSSTLSGQKLFYLNFDINEYKVKKIEYLKDMAKSLANEVVLTKEKRALSPMPSYERRIIHSELSQRNDVFTESQGDGENRHIIINPK
ncbi:MAG: R3H domain-containing nucleic acid-binding protein [Patescibacteria group bacterium]